MTRDDFEYIKLFIKNHSAIEIEDGKEYLVEARCAPIVKEYGKGTINELIRELREHPTEQLKQRIIDVMTTNETLFFRDMHPFELLKNKVIPTLIKKREHEKKLVIWCAAASSGQEPYSIAIILKELGAALDGWTIELIASDISERILLKAQEGLYSQLEVSRGMPMPYLSKYFTQEGTSWRIAQKIRDMVQFKKINVVNQWPVSKADIVFMRNILIYFDINTKKTIFKRLTQLVPEDGYLFVGGSETLLGLSTDFERLADEKAPCYQLKKNSN